jgi:hypothetical protein
MLLKITLGLKLDRRASNARLEGYHQFRVYAPWARGVCELEPTYPLLKTLVAE